MGLVEFRELCHYAQNKRCVSVFYDRFVNLCELKGVSLSKAAVEAGISKSLVTKWKNNSINIPSPEVLDKLSKYFGISISELLGENEQKEKPANDNVDELHLTKNEVKLILWLRSLPPEMREAVLNIPTGSGISDNHQA